MLILGLEGLNIGGIYLKLGLVGTVFIQGPAFI